MCLKLFSVSIFSQSKTEKLTNVKILSSKYKFVTHIAFHHCPVVKTQYLQNPLQKSTVKSFYYFFLYLLYISQISSKHIGYIVMKPNSPQKKFETVCRRFDRTETNVVPQPFLLVKTSSGDPLLSVA